MTLEECFGKLPKARNVKNVLLLTHTDLDAAGAYVMTKLVYPNAEVQHCSNNMMSRVIRNTILDSATIARYDLILVCDISCSEADAEIINTSSHTSKLVLLDHHETAMHLNKYNWACVQNDIISDCDRIDMYPEGTGHSSGASLMYDYLCYCKLMPEDVREKARKVAFIVSAYDTWDWVTVFNKADNVKDCYNFSLLSRIYSLGIYEQKLVENIHDETNTTLYSHDDDLLLSVELGRIQAELDKAKYYIRTGNIRFDGKFHSVVFCNENHYMTETFEYMKENYPGYDYYMMICGGTISIRTVGDINAGEFAARCGGGGHMGAAGVSIPLEKQFERISETLGVDLFVDKKL